MERADPLKRKVIEFGVFPIGVGIIFMVLMLVARLTAHPVDRVDWGRFIVLCLPFITFAIIGVFILAFRNLMVLRISLGILSLAIVLEVFQSPPEHLIARLGEVVRWLIPVKAAIGTAILAVLWKTESEAEQEILEEA